MRRRISLGKKIRELEKIGPDWTQKSPDWTQRKEKGDCIFIQANEKVKNSQQRPSNKTPITGNNKDTVNTSDFSNPIYTTVGQIAGGTILR